MKTWMKRAGWPMAATIGAAVLMAHLICPGCADAATWEWHWGLHQWSPGSVLDIFWWLY
jgi:hypothetical protein